MKTLILLRHAKSSWDNSSLDDHDRPLAARGRRAAPAVAEQLAELELIPDLVACSTAARTRETMDLAADHLGEPFVEYDGSLYLAGPGRLLRTVRATEDVVDTLMVIGHNPGIHAFALGLCDRTADIDLRPLERKFPTAAVAVLEFDADTWEEIDQSSGRLLHFIRPKSLPNAKRDRL